MIFFDRQHIVNKLQRPTGQGKHQAPEWFMDTVYNAFLQHILVTDIQAPIVFYCISKGHWGFICLSFLYCHTVVKTFTSLERSKIQIRLFPLSAVDPNVVQWAWLRGRGVEQDGGETNVLRNSLKATKAEKTAIRHKEERYCE